MQDVSCEELLSRARFSGDERGIFIKIIRTGTGMEFRHFAERLGSKHGNELMQAIASSISRDAFLAAPFKDQSICTRAVAILYNAWPAFRTAHPGILLTMADNQSAYLGKKIKSSTDNPLLVEILSRIDSEIVRLNSSSKSFGVFPKEPPDAKLFALYNLKMRIINNKTEPLAIIIANWEGALAIKNGQYVMGGEGAERRALTNGEAVRQYRGPFAIGRERVAEMLVSLKADYGSAAPSADRSEARKEVAVWNNPASLRHQLY